MGNLCCLNTNQRETILSSLNINDIMQKNSIVERQLNSVENAQNMINIKIMTWTKDSYDLFDFENQSKITQQLTIHDSVELYRNDQNGEISETQQQTYQKVLLKILYNQKYFLIQPSISKEDHPLWLVVKSLQEQTKTQGVRIQLNDVIRIGKIEMKFKELKYDSESSSQNVEGFRSTMLSNSETDDICRLCLNSMESDENPKISPCKCTGTMAYIHLECLQQWITTKYNIQSENQNVIVFFWDQMKCELCKSTFNRNIIHERKTIDIVHKSKQKFKNYAVLEMKRKMVRNEDQIQKVTYILNLDIVDQFKIGRANENHIRLCDISVSRYHCKLIIDNKQLYIHDNGSKFGTLLKIKQSIPLLQEFNQIQIQAGRTIFEFDTNSSLQYQMLLNLSGYPKLF